MAESLRALRESMEFQPGELDELEGRLDQLHRLKRKYGGSEGEMLAFLDDCRRQLDQISFKRSWTGLWPRRSRLPRFYPRPVGQRPGGWRSGSARS